MYLIPKKLWEYEYSYIDLLFPMDLYYNYSDEETKTTLKKSTNPDVIYPCEKLVCWKIKLLSIINYSYVFFCTFENRKKGLFLIISVIIGVFDVQITKWSGVYFR